MVSDVILCYASARVGGILVPLEMISVTVEASVQMELY